MDSAAVGPKLVPVILSKTLRVSGPLGQCVGLPGWHHDEPYIRGQLHTSKAFRCMQWISYPKKKKKNPEVYISQLKKTKLLATN